MTFFTYLWSLFLSYGLLCSITHAKLNIKFGTSYMIVVGGGLGVRGRWSSLVCRECYYYYYYSYPPGNGEGRHKQTLEPKKENLKIAPKSHPHASYIIWSLVIPYSNAFSSFLSHSLPSHHNFLSLKTLLSLPFHPTSLSLFPLPWYSPI